MTGSLAGMRTIEAVPVPATLRSMSAVWASVPGPCSMSMSTTS